MEPPAFFNAVQHSFERAVRSAGAPINRDYAIAGFRVRLNFAGPVLLPFITRAMTHLATSDDREPDLVVHLWETESTGVAPPPPPWDYSDFAEGGLIRKFTTNRFQTHFQFGTNALSLLDSETNQAFYWVKSAVQIPYWEVGAPLRAIFSLWLNQHGRVTLHAGAVGLPAAGVLLVGAGGSGKSNTALSTLPSALSYAGDDYTVLALEPEPVVFSLYNTGKTNQADLARLPFLEPSISNRDRLNDEKALFFLDEHWAHKLSPSFAVKAVLMPHVTGLTDSRLRPASAAAGLNALAPNTFELSPAIEPEAFRMLVELCRRLPCYHLDLGTDVNQPAQLILRLLTPGPDAAAPPGAAATGAPYPGPA